MGIIIGVADAAYQARRQAAALMPGVPVAPVVLPVINEIVSESDDEASDEDYELAQLESAGDSLPDADRVDLSDGEDNDNMRRQGQAAKSLG